MPMTPWIDDDFTPCFHESGLDAGIPVACASISLPTLLVTLIRNKDTRHMCPGYSPLLSQSTPKEQAQDDSTPRTGTEATSNSSLFKNMVFVLAYAFHDPRRVSDVPRTSPNISLTPHLATFFILNISIAFSCLRTTILQEISVIKFALVSCYVIDNLLLAFISLSYKTAPPPALTPTDITKGGERHPCPEQCASWIERAFFTWGNPMIRLGFHRPLAAAEVWDFSLSDYTSAVARGSHASNAASPKAKSTPRLFSLIAKPMERLPCYLGVYAILSVMYVVSLMLREIIQYTGSLHTSRILHQRALDRILHSPIRFFGTTPLGRIINRFTRDMDTVDQQVINVSANVMVDFLSTLTSTGFLAPSLVISALVVIITAFYIRTSRELKRHEATTNSPVYSYFAETLNGVTTICAFGFEERFNSCYQELLDKHSRPYFYVWVCNRWLSIRVDVPSTFVSLFAGLFIVLRRDILDAGTAGLSVIYSLAFTQHVLWFVRTLFYNESNMNCVDRVQEYMILPQEAPANGEIQIQNLVMQYAPDEPAEIRDISFHISPQEKIGIVERTGAGKSTLAVAFFPVHGDDFRKD
ncbi:hypothetical protein BGZ47_009416 [Haplosporangium gracile]|nr:hypothetical protein BGZ47_009416 [Haplosporangium gracile]